MKNLFIDTNIWLTLYHFTKDDLDQFGKLKRLIGNEIKLFIPQQISDEIHRNREAKLKDALERFKLTSIEYPAFCKAYDEYEAFSVNYNSILQRYKQWKDKIDNDILNESLPADKIIHELFELAGIINCDEHIDAAYMRYRKGNPPGKDNKYGDAINWECLMKVVPDSENLYFISNDKDYKSKLSKESFNPFLKNEWRNKKQSDIVFYSDLVTFLNEHIKEIQMKTEQEKQRLIENLSNSASFITTHGLITLLNRHSNWTDEQIENLCSIAEKNSQVYRILGDIDVLNFYSSLLSKINYDTLDDCATKRVMDIIFEEAIAAEQAARDDYEADRYDAYEDYYRH